MAISHRTMVHFTQQLSGMISAGIPLTKSLAALEKQVDDPAFRPVLVRVRQTVESGTSFSAAISQFPEVFSNFFISMIYAGEQGIGLSVVLSRIGSNLERDYALRGKIKGAFMYPLVIGSVAIIVVSLMIIFIVPIFAKVYSQLGVHLPLPTRILLATSGFVRHFWHISIGIIGGVYWGLKKFRGGAFKRELIYKFNTRAPLLGKLTKKVAIAKFVRIFSGMLVCHVPLSEALEVVDTIVKDPEISRVIHHMKTAIESGGSITEAFEKSGIFSPIILQMVGIGEESGTLGELLEKCADTLEQDIDEFAKKLVIVIEPTLTLGLSILIGFIALSIYLPMFDLMTHVGK